MQHKIWVAYASVDRQWVLDLPYRDGLTVSQAIEESGLLAHVELPDDYQVGIFGVKIKEPSAHLLQAGDRVEIYRSLTINPLEIRRNRAKEHPVGRFAKGNRFK